jgi:hypothetical protein
MFQDAASGRTAQGKYATAAARPLTRPVCADRSLGRCHRPEPSPQQGQRACDPTPDSPHARSRRQDAAAPALGIMCPDGTERTDTRCCASSVTTRAGHRRALTGLRRTPQSVGVAEARSRPPPPAVIRDHHRRLGRSSER